MAAFSNTLHKALVEAGVFKEEDQIRRFVIDARVGELVKLYVERVDTQPLETILPRELQGLHRTQIFETGAAERTEIGVPETERETRRREGPGGPRRTEGEERSVPNE